MYHGKGWTASFCDPVLILKLSSKAYHLKPNTHDEPILRFVCHNFQFTHSHLCVPLARCLLDLAEFMHNTFKLKKWVIRLGDTSTCVISFLRMEWQEKWVLLAVLSAKYTSEWVKNATDTPSIWGAACGKTWRHLSQEHLADHTKKRETYKQTEREGHESGSLKCLFS